MTLLAGHWPVAAFVVLARICARSGKTRVGSVPAAFWPGDGERIAFAALTLAAVPKTRNSGPLGFVLENRLVPLPASSCSHR